MLKLFFVITTLMTLVTLARSDEIKNEWICEESDLKGNCSSTPKFKYFIKEIIDNIDNYEYSDNYYCPFNIVERFSKCVYSYYDNCFANMTFPMKYMLLLNLPPQEDNLRILCTKDRSYKQEFLEHLVCLNMVEYDHDVQTEVLRKQWLQNLVLQKLKYQSKIIDRDEQDKPTTDKDIQDKLKMDQIEFQLLHDLNPEKCQNLTNFLRSYYVKIRTLCGLKAVKFFQQIYNNYWPISAVMKNCNKQIYYRT
ncbi:uncharacterized protein LOC113554396 [Rhopalosiphum maidis]|uniref:uncharacterized protein LOC113554396 n=1 Tax=Rhopalosiphum maidis TaxID=43146 RepID=UPI000EFE9166|nr:uncharacterized protein LOC113554396 [Rhopalosiphum maidis]